MTNAVTNCIGHFKGFVPLCDSSVISMVNLTGKLFS